MNQCPDDIEVVDITWGMILKRWVLPAIILSLLIILMLVAAYILAWV